MPEQRVLIIDDEPAILELISESLTRKGYTVDVAENGEKGIEKISSNEYGLILTDMKMPGMSGKDVLKHSRTHKTNGIPVVGMSGTPWLLDKTEFDAVLPKPFSIKELLKVTVKFLNEKTA